MAAWEIQGRDAFGTTSGPATSGGLGIYIQGITTGGFAPLNGGPLTQAPSNSASSGQAAGGTAGTPGYGGNLVAGMPASVGGFLSGSSPILLLAALATIAALFLKR